jgi:hypothetical protein
MIRFNPSSRVTFGSHPKIRLARVISGARVKTPIGAEGSNTGSALYPVSCNIFKARSLILIRSCVPKLIGVALETFLIANSMPLIASLTYKKLLLCSPVPQTTKGFSLSIARLINAGIQ